MRGYLIDPSTRTISTVNIPPDNLAAIYRVCGWDCFDIIRLTARDDLYVDDNGLLTYPNPQGYFQLGDHTIAGRALVLGHDGNGESCDASERVLDALRAAVRWLDTPDAESVEPRMVIVPWDDSAEGN